MREIKGTDDTLPQNSIPHWGGGGGGRDSACLQIVFFINSVKPGFHYTANATTTTQRQSDYKVEQSSFTQIALFLLEVGRCRGRNWLYGNQALGMHSVEP